MSWWAHLECKCCGSDSSDGVYREWNYIVDTAWLAGLLEGEGCFRLRKNRGRVHPDIQINMTDEDVIQRAFKIAGVGTLHGPYTPGGNRKPYWVWKVSAALDAIHVMERVLPYMCQRRSDTIHEVLAGYAAQPEGKTGRKVRR